MIHPEDLMSPTTQLAQLDHLSPVEDLDLDEVDVSLLSEEEETPKTTTPVGETSGLAADRCGELQLELAKSTSNLLSHPQVRLPFS